MKISFTQQAAMCLLVSDTLNTKNIFANDILNKILDKFGRKCSGRKNFTMGSARNLAIFTETTHEVMGSVSENT